MHKRLTDQAVLSRVNLTSNLIEAIGSVVSLHSLRVLVRSSSIKITFALAGLLATSVQARDLKGLDKKEDLLDLFGTTIILKFVIKIKADTI